MCECLKNIAEIASKEYAKNGYDACVQVTVKGQISIAQFVITSSPYEEKRIRLSKQRKYAGIDFNFCPVCGVSTIGQKFKGYQFAQVWDNDEQKEIKTMEKSDSMAKKAKMEVSQ